MFRLMSCYSDDADGCSEDVLVNIELKELILLLLYSNTKQM